jgi:predicted DsbA family dithiol-disulfide isomerase
MRIKATLAASFAASPGTVRGVEARCWSDYLCPWCYISGDQSSLISDLGVPVRHLPYELHPEIPAEGRAVRPHGRLAPTYERIEAECERLALPFRRPTRMPNTRRALETAEVVRRHHAASFPALHGALFHAHFAAGWPLDDAEVLDDLVTQAGAPASEVRAAVDQGRGRDWVDRSMAEARDVGVVSTPTWLVGASFLIPGVQDRDTVRRWVTRMIERADDRSPSDPPPEQ